MANLPPMDKPRELSFLSSFSDWDNVSLAKRAIHQLDQGQFDLAAQMVDAMGRDDRVAACLEQRFQGLLGLPLTWNESEQGDGRRNNAVIDKVRKQWSKMFPEAALYELMKWGHQLGIGIGQLVWDRSDVTMWLPRLQVWHPRYLRWNWDQEQLTLLTRDGDRVITAGDGQWIVYSPYGLRRGWMSGLMRSLYIPWLVRQWAQRDWARYSEVYGTPSRKGVVPYGLPLDKRLEFASKVAAMGSESTIILEQERGEEGERFDVQLIESLGRGWDGFDKAIQACNANIAVRILGQNLTTEVKEGSFAATRVHETVKQEKIDADAEGLTTCLREQALRPFCLFNFGDPELAPWPKFKTEPPEDKKTRGEAYVVLGEGIAALQAVGAKPDVDRILEDADVPTTGPAEEPPATVTPLPSAPSRPKPRLAASGGSRAGYVEGQLYVDAVAEATRDQLVTAAAPEVKAVMAAIEVSTSYEDLRERLLEAYPLLPHDKLSRLLANAIELAELAGRWSAAEDVEG